MAQGKMIDPFQEPVTFTKREVEFRGNLETYFQASPGSNVEKLENFAKYVPRQNLTSFLAQYELFKKVLYVQGSIIECGVYLGGSLMTFAHLSSILEPVNFQRRIIGFDTFSGYPTLSDKDNSEASVDTRVGPLAVDSHEDLMKSIELYDANRFISHIPKVSLVKGDILHTLPKYLEEHRHTVVSLLYLDAGLFEPSKKSLELLLPRMPKGAVLVFGDLNRSYWPGETFSLIETVGIPNLRFQRFLFDPRISFAVIE